MNFCSDVKEYEQKLNYSISAIPTFQQRGASGSPFVRDPHHRQPLLVLLQNGVCKEDPVLTSPPESTQNNNLEGELRVEHPGLLHLNVVCRVHSSRQKRSKDDQYCPLAGATCLSKQQSRDNFFPRTVSRLKLNRNCKINITCM